jgi:hypothetical protein
MMRPFERLLLVLALAVLGLLLWAGYALERTAKLSAPEPTPTALPACVSDDGEGAPCVWLASDRGDERGRSFVAMPGAKGDFPTVIYLDEAREVQTPRCPQGRDGGAPGALRAYSGALDGGARARRARHELACARRAARQSGGGVPGA